MKSFLASLLFSVCVLGLSHGYAAEASSRVPTASIPVVEVVSPKPIKVVANKRNWSAEDKKEIECLARNIYFESRGESEKGQRAVAIVTVNRVAEEGFPDKICDVVYQKRASTKLFRCQFSWYCDGIPDVIDDKEAYKKSRKIAEEIYRDYYKSKKIWVGALRNATHYHATSVQPFWAKEYVLVARIDNHLFYKSKVTT